MPYAPWVKKPSRGSNTEAPKPRDFVTGESIKAPALDESSWSITSRKALLVEEAKARGFNTSGLTKPELIDLLRSI